MGLLSAAESVNSITGSDISRLVVLIGGGGSLLWFIIRNMVNYQKYFTNFYMEENVKLRNELGELRTECDDLREQLRTQIEDLRSKLDTKNDEIYTLKQQNRALQVEVDHLKERITNAGLS